MTTNRLLLNVIALLCLYPGITWAQDTTGCTEQQVAALQEVIDPWIKPATQDDVEPTLSLACKVWPAQPDLTIISVIFEPDTLHQEPADSAGDDTKEWVTLVADKKSARILATHRGQIEVDASVRIHAASLVIDTAAYRLAPGIMAFGIRKNIGYSPSCADGGFDEFLTLFVYVQGKLRPILSEPHLKFWSIDFDSGHHPCGPEQADYLLVQGNTLLKMLKTSSNGFYDLEFVTTAAASWEKAEGQISQYSPYTAKAIARYDGKHYVMPDWFAHNESVQERALEKAAAARSKK
jgi:hypothetical protein